MVFQKNRRRQKSRQQHHALTVKKARKKWQKDADTNFRCTQCKCMVSCVTHMGTQHRNHCPYCLWSKHVDTKPGNRQCLCHGGMKPVGLTIKHNGYDKYGQARQGDIMIVHVCQGCGHININRIAADDGVYQLFALFEEGCRVDPHVKRRCAQQGITLLEQSDHVCLQKALLGKNVKN